VSAPTLAELERAFFAAIARGGPIDAAARAVVSDARGSAADRVALYSGMYFHRILDVLRGDFPSVLAVLGDDGFAGLARDYLLARPSAHPSIRNVGERLAPFLDGHAAAGEWPWLPDLARLEWARVDVFDAADAPLVTVDALRARPPESFAALPLRLIPAQARVDARFAVDEVWHAVATDAAPLSPAAGPRALIVWRLGHDVRHRALDRDEADALAQPSFGAVCDLALARAGEARAAQQAFEWLLRWASEGLLAAA
jgi:hypothetical protein